MAIRFTASAPWYSTSGSVAVTEIECAIEGRLESAITWFEVQDALISDLREYWPDPMPIPAWRRSLAGDHA